MVRCYRKDVTHYKSLITYFKVCPRNSIKKLNFWVFETSAFFISISVFVSCMHTNLFSHTIEVIEITIPEYSLYKSKVIQFFSLNFILPYTKTFLTYLKIIITDSLLFSLGKKELSSNFYNVYKRAGIIPYILKI